MHTLKELYKALSVDTTTLPDLELAGITADSRQVKVGYVFVAERGYTVDGHNYIPQAIASGAPVIVCEYIPQNIDTKSATFIIVPNSAEALGLLASWWYDYPSTQLTLVGVTGTNGKTTIATLLYNMAQHMGEKAGLLSTVVNKVDNTDIPSTHTTPDPLTINKLMRQMVDAGCTFCAMEVSSHACAQRRIAGLKFAGGIFTNLTRDHLDYHKTFDNYLAAKKSFFDSLPSEAFALTNLDDRNGQVMLQNTRANKRTYSIRAIADYMGRVIEDRLDGMLMSFDGNEVETNFMGRFNASNLSAVYAAALLVGWDRNEVLRTLSVLHPVDGRMQTLECDGVTAIVDYAHTPDALANVLATIAEVVHNGRIITVVGAGGNRDKGKRPLMAAEAAKRSDVLIITSDNPRNERAEDIANDMLAGLTEEDMTRTQTIIDRAEAIRTAIDTATAGDVVLVAGKGHETYQIIGDTRHHFDDREQIANAFSLRH